MRRKKEPAAEALAKGTLSHAEAMMASGRRSGLTNQMNSLLSDNTEGSGPAERSPSDDPRLKSRGERSGMVGPKFRRTYAKPGSDVGSVSGAALALMSRHEGELEMTIRYTEVESIDHAGDALESGENIWFNKPDGLAVYVRLGEDSSYFSFIEFQANNTPVTYQTRGWFDTFDHLRDLGLVARSAKAARLGR